MSRHSISIWFAAVVLALAILVQLAGCARGETATPVAAAPAPSVSVATVVSRQISDFDEFTGRFEAVDRVEIRPRVTGYISSINFVEGREVTRGELLFVIDPRPYEAELKRAQAQLEQARSQLTLATSEQDRANKLLAAHAVSREELESREAALEQAHANVAGAQAAVDTAALNLGFTRVAAPITGVVSRAQITAGNLVTSGETLLTTVVSVDPIYVSFQGDEQGFLNFMNYARKGGEAQAAHPVFVGLANEEGYPHQGTMAFVDNEIDAATGTVRARGRLDNHNREFTPGMFARVKVIGPKTYPALLINESAVGTDQGLKYVLRVGADNAVEYRQVKLGPVVDGLRVVREGLNAGDTIVVNGLQHVRPGMTITPQRVAMGEQNLRPAAATPGLVARNAR
ncbi:MAG TPA: efflux RND transporter periplasmic adaptor subunit [Steroidobacteraceae bacterium]|nr:efflux RND transporter periplasmic adaptor subunit [Steroidobacteraceae bacterium]